MGDTQLSFLGPTQVQEKKTEAPTTVRLGHRSALVPLAKRRREALKKLREVLQKLEGKDVYVEWCSGARGHFWANNLVLHRMEAEPWAEERDTRVVVLWGRRGASVRIFTEQLYNVREQEYQGYTCWLLDFWNGFGEHPINPYRIPGYDCLQLKRFKD